jgi:hypothetical protein
MTIGMVEHVVILVFAATIRFYAGNFCPALG